MLQVFEIYHKQASTKYNQPPLRLVLYCILAWEEQLRDIMSCVAEHELRQGKRESLVL